jgi:hypothetical protein
MRLHATTGKRRGFADCIASRGKPEAEVKDGASPFLVEFFMVQGIGFRCMAWLGYDGKWRTAFENRILPGLVRVVG